MSDTPYDEHFVSWFRAVTPYINSFRTKIPHIADKDGIIIGQQLQPSHRSSATAFLRLTHLIPKLGVEAFP